VQRDILERRYFEISLADYDFGSNGTTLRTFGDIPSLAEKIADAGVLDHNLRHRYLKFLTKLCDWR
jgi:hypothetical protein